MTYANGRSGRRKPGATRPRRARQSASVYQNRLLDRRRERTPEECDADFARLRPDGKACKSCGEIFDTAAAFPRDWTRADGRDSRCRRCRNRNRTIRATARLRRYWLARGIDPDTCFYCPAPAEHVDHFHPRALDGTDALENLVPACAPCNLRKRDMPPITWLNLLLTAQPLRRPAAHRQPAGGPNLKEFP
ncbi:HNH endonuclease [Microbacterium phage Finalfrontier]|nr:HNH endonuclease [Microbacterium phage Finalfrontier]